MTFALVGNQNCGKTTLFNRFTGSNQHVGNFPGVTVDQKIGTIKGLKNCRLVDLPGIYSLCPYSSEEIVTRDFIFEEKPDAIINIVDATNIVRNLYLTIQLLDIGIPIVLALNMMDEVRSNNGSIDVSRLSKDLKIPVVPISASKNEGISDLIKSAVNAAKNGSDIAPPSLPGPIEECIKKVSDIIYDRAEKTGLSPRLCAVKLIEQDQKIVNMLGLKENSKEEIESCIKEAERKCDMDRYAAIADARYDIIEKICLRSVKKQSESKEQLRSRRIDRLLTNRYLALPIFIGIMIFIFYMTFGAIGKTLSDILSCEIGQLSDVCDRILTAHNANRIIHSLIIDGIFVGVGSVLNFLPIIVVLFFFLSLLEDTGYMARVAFVTDKLIRKIGLSGRSIVSMLIGFGCTVPAVMSSRTIPSDRDRKMTILLTPFISCSAKIPIYAVFCKAFFKNYAVLVMSLLYFGGIAVGILCALIMKNTLFTGEPVPFVMELPNYRLPSPKSVALLMWEKAKEFIIKAFTIIFVGTILIWFLQTFDAGINPVENSSDSLLALIGQLISPIFSPLGFGDWRITTSLIAGFSAKEAVISTMGVLIGADSANLPQSLPSMFTVGSAISFLSFTLLYTPCIAAISTIKRELGSRFKTLLFIIFQCSVAWLVSFAVFKITKLII